MSEIVNDELKETYQQLLKEKPKGIQLTGRVRDALKAPAGRYPIACTTFAVEDTMEGYDGIEASWIFTSRALRYGAGVAIDLSKIRAKGTENKDGLVASGPVSFAYFYSFAVEKLRKGGLYRNGATTLFLDYNHPDILEFLNLAPQELPWAKRAVYIDENLLDAPKEVLDTLCLKVSEGSVWLAKKQWDKDGERLYSNVCLAGDTLVVTRQGHVPIRELVGKIVEIWNGQAWVTTDSFTMTSELEPLIEIKLHNGKSIKATKYHKFPMADGTNKRAFELKKQEVIRAHSVKPDNDTSERVETNTEIISVRPSPPEPVYCCTIESTGTFALSCGVLTRNCLEVALKHRATCMLLPVNLGALELEEIPEQMEQGMRYLCKLHGLSRAGESGIYLSPTEDKQVGLGVIGLANLLARYKVKYADFVGALEYLLEIDTDAKVDQALPFRLARSIIQAYNDAAEVAREFSMERAFAIAPTATVAFNGRDSDQYTTSPEISAPLERSVDRDSDRFGVVTYDYHPDTEVAREVGWDVQSRLLVAWQVLMENTGLAHAISANLWQSCQIDEAFLKWFLMSPLKTTYYRMQTDQQALNKSEIITPENISADQSEDNVTTGISTCALDDPAYCSGCGG